MTKEVRHCKVVWERSVSLDILVDKDTTDAELKRAIMGHFGGFGDDWLFDKERIYVFQGKKKTLKEYMVYIWGKKFNLFSFNEDMDIESLGEYYQRDFHKLVKEQGEI